MRGKFREQGISAEQTCRQSRRNPATVLQGLGPQIQWVQSYVTEDKIYCVYIAPNKELVLEHARKAGFPANSVAEVKRMIDPTTAE